MATTVDNIFARSASSIATKVGLNATRYARTTDGLAELLRDVAVRVDADTPIYRQMWATIRELNSPQAHNRLQHINAALSDIERALTRA